jgi:hypothetical protein
MIAIWLNVSLCWNTSSTIYALNRGNQNDRFHDVRVIDLIYIFFVLNRMKTLSILCNCWILKLFVESHIKIVKNENFAQNNIASM